MDDEKLTTADEPYSATIAQAASVTLKSTIARRRANVKILQNVLLIWLDPNIDEENNADYQNTISQLQNVVNTFTNGDQCLEFIETIDSNNRKICMIISGSLAQDVMPHVHKMSHVDSIFIFCSNKQHHHQWVKDWSKIKGVFTEIIPICEALKVAAQECEHNAIPMSFLTTGGDDDTQKKVDQLDYSFMYTQILKDVLLTITFEPKHIQEFIEYCREQFAENLRALIDVEKLGRNYRNQTPVWWYTCESFMYLMLSTALRLMDVNVMIKIGFFISDLHRQINELYKEQFGDLRSNTTFTVYCGQDMPKDAFPQMNNTKGGLLAFNSFVSTSKSRHISHPVADRVVSNLVGILFVMMIDPWQSITPFASINDVGFFQDKEDEVLFSMHSTFRIRDIKSIDEDGRLYQVNLAFTSDNDKDLRVLTDRLNEEIADSTGWDRLGRLLLRMQQSKKAEEVYQFLLEQSNNEIEKATFYHRLGMVKDDQGEYKEALAFYRKALAIRQKSFPPTHPDLAESYNNIGSVYDDLGDYSKALFYYEKALAIRQELFPLTHPDLAFSYNSIGNVHFNIGAYSNALTSYEKALTIRQESLPPTHPHLASSYNNIGNVFFSMGDYSNALSSYEKALAIRQQSLPQTHSDLAASYNNIGNVCFNMGDYSKALLSYEKALTIRQQSLPPTHPYLAFSYNNIGNVYDEMGDYSKALSFYEKALTIRQQSLPPIHPHLAASYNNIGVVYRNMDDYSKALSYYEKALAIRQESLPSTHPDMAESYDNIGLVYENMGDYSKARSFCKCALEIAEQSLPPNHPDLQIYRRNFDNMKNV